MTSQLKKSVLSMIVASALVAPVFADKGENNSALKDAWLDGKLDTVILLNRHLNPFKIQTDVTNGVAVITGKVDSEVEKDLAGELAKGVDGIKDIDNRLVVSKSAKKNEKNKEKDTLADDITDAAITTAISTKLLLNTEIDSTEIDVDTTNRKVALSGAVESDAERDLVVQIAKNTFKVKDVTDKLKVR